ncbi:MAG: hypothetical protein K5654_01410 [Lachnospiraceae bacterium]|nr:hypothetical protein [Lachnospiraceae bacterium]
MSTEDKNITEKENKKRGVSILGIFEILILLLGVAISIRTTIKPLHYTTKYVWCFGIALIGLVFIAILIILLKKRFVWLIGALLIFIYIYVAGFGAIVCEVNAGRLKRVSWYEGKEVIAVLDDTTYVWDGKSVIYNSSDLEILDKSRLKTCEITVDGESRNCEIYKEPDPRHIFLEVESSSTGIYFVLTRIE